ncbi:hypothetical protein [Zoogloea sp.]|uniref:hypothetical protein n=1 Tax=Zoogloea sp. TaxID=49181 RepID=UPI002628C2E3|nr:hypothetical protein [Zoogloea sp.]MDD3353075.1 hypothetical protein [Zoogloea sp.]
MPSNPVSHRPSVVLLLGLLAFSSVGCAETAIYQQGSSRTVVRQTDGDAPTRSTVERTPTSQKIITRTGKSTDVTIQSSSPKGAPPAGRDVSSRRSRATAAPDMMQEDCGPQPGKKAGPGATNRECTDVEYDSVDDMEAAARKRFRPVPSVDDLEERAKRRIQR